MYFFAFGSSQYHAETVLTTMYEDGSHGYKVDMEIDALLKKQRTITDPDRADQGDRAGISQEQREPLSPAALRRVCRHSAQRRAVGYSPWPDGFVRLYDFK